jgi:hypothetical protein
VVDSVLKKIKTINVDTFQTETEVHKRRSKWRLRIRDYRDQEFLMMKSSRFKVEIGAFTDGVFIWAKNAEAKVSWPGGSTTVIAGIVLPEAYSIRDKCYTKAPFHSFEVPYMGKRFILNASKNAKEWTCRLETDPKGMSTSSRHLGQCEGTQSSAEEAMEAACQDYVKKLKKERAILDAKIAKWE